MLNVKSITGPGVNGSGQFSVTFGQFEKIKTDQVTSKLTANAASLQTHVFVPVSDVGLFAVGDTVKIADSASNETKIIQAINIATGDITMTLNLTNSYTVANGAYLAFPATATPLCSVSVNQPFTAATLVGVGWSVSGNVVTVTVELSTGGAGISWAAAINSDIASVQFFIEVDGE
jgi:hypothetical protein